MLTSAARNFTISCAKLIRTWMDKLSLTNIFRWDFKYLLNLTWLKKNFIIRWCPPSNREPLLIRASHVSLSSRRPSRMNLELSIRFPSIVPEAVCKLYLSPTFFSLSLFWSLLLSLSLGCRYYFDFSSVPDIPKMKPLKAKTNKLLLKAIFYYIRRDDFTVTDRWSRLLLRKL